MYSYYSDVLEPVITSSPPSDVEFLRNKGILKRVINCPFCVEKMKTVDYNRNVVNWRSGV